MTEKSALVTGAEGFIGTYLVKALLKKNWKVFCLVRNKSKKSKNIAPGITCIEGDITKKETLKALHRPFDCVFHLAAEGHVAASGKKAYEKFKAVNVKGTDNLLNALDRKSVRKFIHFSSTAAVGLIKNDIVNENTTPKPVTPYQKSKLESEHKALKYHENEGFPVIILRPCMVYGKGGKGEFLKIVKLIKKGIFPKVGSGKALTPIVHVSDVVRSALLAAEKGTGGEIYFICGHRSYPMAEIREYILQSLNMTRPYLYIPLWIAYIAGLKLELLSMLTGKPSVATRRNILSTAADRVFDISKAQKELGYEPSVIIEEGVEETIKWFKKEGFLK